MDDYIIKDSFVDKSSKLFKNVRVTSSSVDGNCTIGDNSSILKSKLGFGCIINRNCSIDQSEIGLGSYLNQNTVVKKSLIGKFCCISWNVTIYAGENHNFNAPSMYTSYHWRHIFGSSTPQPPMVGSKTTIGNDVWIGNGAIIINSVSVGDGAIIGAGAVVTKNIPPYSIVAGVPAKVLRKRFNDTTIDRLLLIKWWDWPLEIIAQYEELLRINPLSDDSLLKMEKISKSLGIHI